MLNPVLVHDEAAAFVDEYTLNELFQEWRARTSACLARPAGESSPYPAGAGRGTRRGRDEYDGDKAEGQASARRRR